MGDYFYEDSTVFNFDCNKIFLTYVIYVTVIICQNTLKEPF